MVWCGSTEIFMGESPAHQSLAAFEAGLLANDVTIPSSMIYTYAALKEGIPFANGAPNLSCDIPAMVELAALTKTPIVGKDLKTGQTLDQDDHRAGPEGAAAGVEGWYSTNILGNRDGEVLDDPESFKTKEESKKSVSTTSSRRTSTRICTKRSTTSCASTTTRRVETTRKAGTTSIWWVGWATRCSSRSTSCAATASWRRPSCSDVALFLDLAKRAGLSGIQEWLSFYFKSPQHAPGLYPEHDLFIQLMKLKNTMRWMIGEELITHLGREYYD
jgi:myo-inositol-1-phosphate synthase